MSNPANNVSNQELEPIPQATTCENAVLSPEAGISAAKPDSFPPEVLAEPVSEEELRKRRVAALNNLVKYSSSIRNEDADHLNKKRKASNADQKQDTNSDEVESSENAEAREALRDALDTALKIKELYTRQQQALIDAYDTISNMALKVKDGVLASNSYEIEKVKCADLEKQLTAVNAKSVELESQLAEVRTFNQSLRADLTNEVRDNTALRNKCSTLADGLDDAEENIKNLETDKNNLVHLLDASTVAKFTCNICKTDNPAANHLVTHILICKHLLCGDCISNLKTEFISDEQEMVKCPFCRRIQPRNTSSPLYFA